MTGVINFKEVSTAGLESSPCAGALAGLRANEARYFWNKYKHEFTTQRAQEAPEILSFIEKVLQERDLTFSYKALEVSQFQVDGVLWSYVFYENGLSINVLYSLDDAGKRAVGFKLSDGMEIPQEFEGKFKFARQKSKLAGTIRGSYFVVKGSYL
ncbi:phage tail protein [Granulicatella seriolae]|uniref:Phage tail protein n=1 Tax=Granulicatella seriolae TaxID=2967226 RepID=A0ABT1WPR5_9LACT|nr:phage tail protein [Granulicatella seriolae]